MIRVLRVIEYEYKDADRMVEDMGKWTVQLDVYNLTMRSAVVATTKEGDKYLGE